MGVGGVNVKINLTGVQRQEELRRQQLEAARARVAESARLASIDNLKKKKNPGRRDRFGRRMTNESETILGGRAGLDEAATARFGANPSGGKTILGV